MGFWYFLILFVGIFLLIRAFIKQSMTLFNRLTVILVGACMIVFSLFMFQDGSAEIVDSLLKSLNLNYIQALIYNK